jgi:hypothetical protein
MLLISRWPTSLFFVPFQRPTRHKVWHCSRHSRVNLDYHIEIAKHYYSVPHNLVFRRLRLAKLPIIERNLAANIVGTPRRNIPTIFWIMRLRYLLTAPWPKVERSRSRQGIYPNPPS